LRLGNIYGSGETAFKKLIPETIRRILRKKPPIIHGTGEEKRSFLNVKDCVSAIWKSIELDEFIGPVNIVSSPSVKVREIIHHLIRISGLSSEIRIVNNNSDLYDIIYNNNKMLKHLVSETVSLEDGLTEEFNFEKTKLQTSLL
jgi:UDP-glucose 4-epimerase